MHAALRFARAATGRNTVVRFEGHYHGWFSDIAVSGPGTPPAAADRPVPLPPVAASAGLGRDHDVLVARWNDPIGLETLLRERGSEIAAVIMEPVPLAGVLEPLPGYLEAVRALTERHGIVLIFDEVVTGFRAGLAGAQGRFGVVPDVTVLGKALGAGLPISAVAGRSAVLDTAAGPAPHMGTFNGHPLATAAALAALECYMRPGFDARLERLAGQLADGLRKVGERHGHDLAVHRLGALLQTHFVRDPGRLADYADVTARTDRAAAGAFAESLLRRGVYLPPRNTWMLSSAHTDADIDLVLDRADTALAGMRECTA
ncbi:hypothetical protein Ssi02_54390 [Sinosporangium siamense]|uniref:Aminotransferase class III-fold pyridoxal phosphate-dependent enzyme n=1 Tax=Sinosporangium siamense TaxID=1367973 RepID=A0A919V991_9ACTN|nr:hypothetical protein Ssi02_54390 [Sinosporangium siamense]